MVVIVRYLDTVSVQIILLRGFLQEKYIVKLKAARGCKWKHSFHHGKSDFIACVFEQYILYTLWKKKDISSWQFPHLLLCISSVLYLKCLLNVIKGSSLSQTFVKNGLFKLLVLNFQFAACRKVERAFSQFFL